MTSDLVPSFFTVSGAGFGEPPRDALVDRCRADAGAGLSGIGLHVNDGPRVHDDFLANARSTCDLPVEEAVRPAYTKAAGVLAAAGG